MNTITLSGSIEMPCNKVSQGSQQEVDDTLKRDDSRELMEQTFAKVLAEHREPSKADETLRDNNRIPLPPYGRRTRKN